jgi:hypothetical protein
VRVGRPEATRPELLPYSVDAIAGEAASEAMKRAGGDPKQVRWGFMCEQMHFLLCYICSAFLENGHFKVSLMFLLTSVYSSSDSPLMSRTLFLRLRDNERRPPTRRARER